MNPDSPSPPDPNLSDLGRAMLGGGSGGSGSRPSGPWLPPTPEELQALLPNYQILTMLGRGGMGAVYMGRQITLDRPVAIKILSGALEDSDLGFKERFKNEARAMAKLSHPGIVAVHDFGETGDGLLYIVMEYVDGTDVSRMIAAEGRLHTEYAMAITAHVCDALAYAHERGIIHRDIKPANIMVGYDGVVKVADFGLAKVHGDGSTLGLTMSGVAMGTMHFMAPEALTSDVPVDHRADLYAVGVMLYQMLTGRLPQGMFELPSLLVPGLDPRYDGIIARALREDREQRYSSARDLRADLDAILTQPVPRIEDAPSQAVSALPTMARPKRPGAGATRRTHPLVPAKGAAKKSSGRIVWVSLVVIVLSGVAYWFYSQRDTGGSTSQITIFPRTDEVSLTTSTTPTTPKAVESKPSIPSTSSTVSTSLATQGTTSPLPSSITPANSVQTAPNAGGIGRTSSAEPNSRTEGRFRSWSSLPDDPVIDLTRLRGVDDPKQVLMNGAGWVVLRRNGQIVSNLSGTEAWTDVRRICRCNGNEFALIHQNGELTLFPARTDSVSKVPDNLGPVNDFYMTETRHVALLENGELVLWGKAHDGRGNDEWKDMPSVPTGTKAVAMWNAPFTMAVKLNNGRLLAWGANHGKARLPASLASGEFDHFAINHTGILAIPKDGGPMLSWSFVRIPMLPFQNAVRGVAFLKANKASENMLLLDQDGKVDLDPRCVDRKITEVLDFVTAPESDLVSIHLSTQKAPDRVLWFQREQAKEPMEKPSTNPSLSTANPDQHPDIRSRIANYQKTRQTQLADLTEKYRIALVAARDGAPGDRTPFDAEIAAVFARAAKIAELANEVEPAPLASMPTLHGAATDRLKELRRIFEGETSKIESTLVAGLDQSIGAVETGLVREGKTAEAGTVKDLRARIVTAFSVSTAAPKTDDPVPNKNAIANATKERPFVNSLGMKFVPVPITGGPTNGKRLLFSVWETRVRDFAAFAAETSLENQSWRNVSEAGATQNDDHPVLNVTWDDANAFCEWLAAKEGLPYRLPTDHEWSCAAGLGAAEDAATAPVAKMQARSGKFPWGRDEQPPARFANYKGASDAFPFTAPVGSFAPTEHGLHDLWGNASEWCADWHDPSLKTQRVVRGHSWFNYGPYRVSSMRLTLPAGGDAKTVGFRIVLELP